MKLCNCMELLLYKGREFWTTVKIQQAEKSVQSMISLALIYPFDYSFVIRATPAAMSQTGH